MKLVDARSGQSVELPSGFSPTTFSEATAPVFRYPDGERVVVLHVEPGLLEGYVLARVTVRDLHSKRLVTIERWIRCPVRYMHPNYRFQRVMFYPS